MKYGEWLEIWLENYVKISVKERTFVRYATIVRKQIVPRLGEKEFGALTPVEIQKFVTDMLCEGNAATGEGLAPNTVNTVVAVVRNSLRTAKEAGVADAYVGCAVRRPRRKEKKAECFTLAEQRKIERAVAKGGKEKLFGIVLCLYTGLRIGEVVALRWEDVDFRRRVMTVCRSCHDVRGGKAFDDPKTPFSSREIPLPRPLFRLLRERKKKSRSEFVVSEKGKSVSVRSYQRTFGLLLARLGLPHRGFHSLRHTFATRALECGMDVKTLSEILGHKNPTVTLSRYAHSLTEHKAAMMEKLGKLMPSAPSWAEDPAGEDLAEKGGEEERREREESATPSEKGKI